MTFIGCRQSSEEPTTSKGKPVIVLQLEGEDVVKQPTPEQVREALSRMSPTDAPGYMILEGPGEDYAQVAGGDGVFTVEWREHSSSGFRHWKAGLHGKPTSGDAVVPTTSGDITVKSNERLNLDEVEAIFVEFLTTKGRSEKFAWRDISGMFE